MSLVSSLFSANSASAISAIFWISRILKEVQRLQENQQCDWHGPQITVAVLSTKIVDLC